MTKHWLAKNKSIILKNNKNVHKLSVFQLLFLYLSPNLRLFRGNSYLSLSVLIYGFVSFSLYLSNAFSIYFYLIKASIWIYILCSLEVTLLSLSWSVSIKCSFYHYRSNSYLTKDLSMYLWYLEFFYRSYIFIFLSNNLSLSTHLILCLSFSAEWL